MVTYFIRSAGQVVWRSPGARSSYNAARTIGLIDSSKFGRASLLTIARAQELDAIVTDDGLDEQTAQEYRAAGVRLEIVKT